MWAVCTHTLFGHGLHDGCIYRYEKDDNRIRGVKVEPIMGQWINLSDLFFFEHFKPVILKNNEWCYDIPIEREDHYYVSSVENGYDNNPYTRVSLVKYGSFSNLGIGDRVTVKKN